MKKLPIGFYDFHKDNLVNFQLNRFYSTGVLPLEEVKKAGKRIDRLEDFATVMEKLAKEARQRNDILQAAVYYRAAEFLSFGDDAKKMSYYDKCMTYYQKAYKDEPIICNKVPYKNGYLQTMHVKAEGETKATILIHGGYDSFIQEFYPFLYVFRTNGYDVILFEGPGQGSALYEYGYTMDFDWHIPTSLVLDYYDLSDVILIGVSLGGFLATKAAAYEERISQVVLYDLVYDMYGAIFGDMKLFKHAVSLSLMFGFRPMFRKIEKMINGNYFAQWLLAQGYHVFGVDTLQDYYGTIKKCHTRKVSAKIKQDVLVLAGEDDIYTKYMEKQKAALSNARSCETRIFTKEEHASHHCQIGNLELVLEYICDWIGRARNNVDS
jgi:pimeloyl-ACP methyl ester carboxylesterase